ncbi:endonuclease [Mycoplasma sp. 125]|uniref:endonuclease n=1 Tax=Mycoplasma sp. 125 TaxID=3447505 RepID=UPI003F654A7F
MKKTYSKNIMIYLTTLTLPTTFLILSSCSTQTQTSENEKKYLNKKEELLKNILKIKDNEKLNKLWNKLEIIESKENSKNFDSLIKEIEILNNETLREISPSANPNDKKSEAGSENNPITPDKKEKDNRQQEQDNNTLARNGAAPTTNNGFHIQYDNSNKFYESLNGLSGQELRDKLFMIQLQNRDKTGVGRAAYAKLHNTYVDAFVDKYYEKDGTVLDLYTEIIGGKDKYNFEFGKYRDIGNKEGQGMNREHIIAQSWFAKQGPMRNDAHHVWPSDKKVNAIHGNLPYGETQNGKIVSSNGSKLGIGKEDGEQVFEVIDEFKGDIARVFFYFVLTYRDKNITNNHSAQRVFFEENGINQIKQKYLETYLKWNKLDGISQFDIDRNNGVYKHQRNRNPFTDYPELIKVYFEHDDNYVFQNKGIAIKLVKN